MGSGRAGEAGVEEGPDGYPLLDALRGRRSRRYPAYNATFQTFLGHQSTHVDEDFYDGHYRPEALSETPRRHADRWRDAEVTA